MTRQQQVNMSFLSPEDLKQWQSHWLYAGSVRELAECGDFFTVQAGLTPVIVARNHEHKLVVLNNSCRHRGSRVCQNERGSRTNFVCPYHQWTYDLDGNLTYAHFMMDEIDLAEFSLVPLAGKIEDGHIYIHLSEDNSEASNHIFEQPEKDTLCTDCLLFQLNAKKSLSENLLALDDAAFQALLKFDAFNRLEKVDSIKRFEKNALSIQYEKFSLVVRALPDRNGLTELSVKCFSLPEHAACLKDALCEFINDNALLWESVSYQHDELIKQWNNEEMLEAIQNIPQHDTLLKEAIAFESFFDQKKLWNAEHEYLTCSFIVDETPNVKTFTFQTPNASWFHYKPGQFITLEIPVGDEPVLRTYTLASSPSRPLSVSVTIKASPQSIGTRWLFDNLKIGDSLKAYGPAGEFSFFNQPAQKYLFISAGSGITPMMSMSRWMYDYGNYEMDVNFISCVMSPADILFRRELEGMAKRVKGFRVSWVCENDPDNSWTGYRGRFNKLMLGLISPDYIERDVYCCGPPPFMKAVREALFDSGFNMNHYYEESFSSPGASEQEIDFSQMPDEHISVSVKFTKSGKEVSCNQNGTLLNAARAADVAIPSACGFGVCGTCKVKVVSGESHMVHSGGISQRDIDKGYVLACCTKPLSQIEIEA